MRTEEKRITQGRRDRRVKRRGGDTDEAEKQRDSGRGDPAEGEAGERVAFGDDGNRASRADEEAETGSAAYSEDGGRAAAISRSRGAEKDAAGAAVWTKVIGHRQSDVTYQQSVIGNQFSVREKLSGMWARVSSSCIE